MCLIYLTVTFQSCIVCDSSVSGQANCATTGISTEQLCKDYMDICRNHIVGKFLEPKNVKSYRECIDLLKQFVISKEGGKIIRGCKGELSEIACIDGTKTCFDCDTNNCNNGTFPAHRLMCYQCTSSDVGCDLLLPTEQFGYGNICPVWKADQKCYASRTASNYLTRKKLNFD